MVRSRSGHVSCRVRPRNEGGAVDRRYSPFFLFGQIRGVCRRVRAGFQELRHGADRAIVCDKEMVCVERVQPMDTHLTTRPRIRVSSGRPGAGGARLHDHALVGVPPWSAAGRDCARRVATALALLPSGPTAQQANCACLLSPVCRQDRCERWLQACRAWHDGGRVRGLAHSRSAYRGRSRRQVPGTARPRRRPSRTPSSTCSSENKTSIRTDWQKCQGREATLLVTARTTWRWRRQTKVTRPNASWARKELRSGLYRFFRNGLTLTVGDVPGLSSGP